MRLKDMVAIVTGGGSGFGEAICRSYAAEGAKVVIGDLSVESGERVAASLRETGAQAAFCRTDVSRSGDMQALVAVAIREFGRLDLHDRRASGPLRATALPPK